MNRRRALVVLAFTMAPVSAIVASCSFPELPAFTPDQDGAADTGLAETNLPSDGAADGDGRVVPTDVDPDGGSQEAATRPEGGAQIDAAGCSCDCDNDGFQKLGGGCDGGPGPRPDCDDLDDFIKPDAGFVAVAWTSTWTPSGDWNCDGVRTKQYTYNVKCNDVNNCVAGFNDDPNCGEAQPYNICKYDPGIAGIVLASCKIDHSVTVTQGCR